MKIRRQRPVRAIVAIVLVNLVLLGGALIVAEVVARTFFPRCLDSLFDDPELFIRDRPFVMPHTARGFALNPGFDEGDYRINAAGFRGLELPVDLDRQAIVLALGESTTFGWRVGEDETYPAILQALLDERADDALYVVNGGVPSYSSAQVGLYLDELLPALAPRAVIVSVLWNDLWYSAVRQWHPDLLVRQQPSRRTQQLLRHSGLYRALVLRDEARAGERDVDKPEALRHYRRNLEAMARASARQGVDLAFLEAPLAAELVPESGVAPFFQSWLSRGFYLTLAERYATAMREVAERYDLAVISHPLAIGQAAPAECFVDFLHPSAAGNRLIAEAVARYLLIDAAADRAARRPQ